MNLKVCTFFFSFNNLHSNINLSWSFEFFSLFPFVSLLSLSLHWTTEAKVQNWTDPDNFGLTLYLHV